MILKCSHDRVWSNSINGSEDIQLFSGGRGWSRGLKRVKIKVINKRKTYSVTGKYNSDVFFESAVRFRIHGTGYYSAS